MSILGSVLDSQQSERRRLLKSCSSGSIEELRSFIGMFYLGHPPDNSMFNGDGSQRSSEQVCQFLRENGLNILKKLRHWIYTLAKNSAVEALISVYAKEYVGLMTFFLYSIIRYSELRFWVGRLIGENRKVAIMNKKRIVDHLESQVIECVGDQKEGTESADSNFKRASILKSLNNTIYMIMTADGKLRNEAGMACAERIMTRSNVKILLSRYTEGLYPSPIPAHMIPLSSSTIAKISNSIKVSPPVKIAKRISKSYMNTFSCSEARVRLLNMPPHLYLSEMRIMLTSKRHVHVTDHTPVEPVLLKPRDNANKLIKPTEACGLVMGRVEAYLIKKTGITAEKIQNLWSKGKIRIAFSNIKLDKGGDVRYYLMIVQMPRNYLPRPQAVRTHIKLAVAASLAGAALSVLGVRVAYRNLCEQLKNDRKVFLEFGLKLNASESEIESRYKKMSLEVHPDKNRESIEEATATTKKLNSDHEIILEIVKQRRGISFMTLNKNCKVEESPDEISPDEVSSQETPQQLTGTMDDMD